MKLPISGQRRRRGGVITTSLNLLLIMSSLLVMELKSVDQQAHTTEITETFEQISSMQQFMNAAFNYFEMSEMLDSLDNDEDDIYNVEQIDHKSTNRKQTSEQFSKENKVRESKVEDTQTYMVKFRDQIRTVIEQIKTIGFGMVQNKTQILQRNLKFQRPPKLIEEILANDDIEDPWEALDAGKEPEFVPIIGILTQPTSESKKKNFNFTDYILEVNDNFVKWSGSKTLAIPYDISEKDLLTVLDQINGVLLTGGALTLIDDAGNLHPYYQTAKRVIEYSKNMKDQFGQDWPVLGICQGLEVVSIYQANDDIKALDLIDIYGENRPINWTNAKSRFFGDFPDDLRDRMEEEGLALHAHTYSTSIGTYMRIQGLKDEMIVTQTDIWHDAKNLSGSSSPDIEFIAAMEHKKYPIFTSMYHPEYQLLVFTGDRKWTTLENDQTDEIAFRFSLKLNRIARSNKNRVHKGNEALFNQQYALNRVAAERYPMIDGIEVYAYGFNGHPTVAGTSQEQNA